MKNSKYILTLYLFFCAFLGKAQNNIILDALEGNFFSVNDPIPGFTLSCGTGKVTNGVYLRMNVNTAGAGNSVRYTIPYTATGTAIGTTYPALEISSTGAGTNLKAKLAAGTLVSGGSFQLMVNEGTPVVSGIYRFSFTIGGQTCNFELSTCGAFTAPGVWKEFMCHNLGADTSLDPHTVVPGIQGARYQWGQKNPVLTQAQDQANSGAVSGWVEIQNPAGTWGNPKTANDPCPTGYRVPTKTEWDGVIANNTMTFVGSFTANWTTSGVRYGNSLTLPTKNIRYGIGGGTIDDGTGRYSSVDTDPSGPNWQWSLRAGKLWGIFDQNETRNFYKHDGNPIRCIAE